MASGDLLFVLTPQSAQPPGTLYATPDEVVDASTPTRNIPVLDFDGAADEHADWIEKVPTWYDGGGLTFSYSYAMDGTDGDTVELEFRALTLADASSVLTSDLGIDTQTAATLTDDPSATADEFNQAGTVGLSHANAGSPAVKASLLIRATRDVSVAANDDDLQLMNIFVTET